MVGIPLSASQAGQYLQQLVVGHQMPQSFIQLSLQIMDIWAKLVHLLSELSSSFHQMFLLFVRLRPPRRNPCKLISWACSASQDWLTVSASSQLSSCSNLFFSSAWVSSWVLVKLVTCNHYKFQSQLASLWVWHSSPWFSCFPAFCSQCLLHHITKLSIMFRIFHFITPVNITNNRRIIIGDRGRGIRHSTQRNVITICSWKNYDNLYSSEVIHKTIKKYQHMNTHYSTNLHSKMPCQEG